MTFGIFDTVDLTGVRYFPNYAWDYVPATAGAAAPGFGSIGVVALQVAIPTPDNPKVGAQSKTFADDFYERIHVSTLSVNVGTVVSSQIRVLGLWNGFRYLAKTLTSLGMFQAEGIELSGQTPPPLEFLALQERTYTMTVTSQGPPTINADVVFTFNDGTVIEVEVVGRRALAWTARPNWSDFVTERLEWLTDVLPSKYGKEQRRSLRIGPRKLYEFSFVLHNRARRMMENAMLGWGIKPFVMPLWPEGSPLMASLAAGVSIIPVTTYGRAYREGGLVMFLVGPEKYEIAEVDSVAADSITLKSPLVQAWSAGSKVYPAITVAVDQEISLSRMNDTLSGGSVRMRSIESLDLYNAPAFAPTLYDGLPVLTVRPSESTDPTTEYAREFVLVDSQSGKDYLDDISDVPRITQSHRWMLTGIGPITEFRNLLYYLRGKWKSLWVPTFRQDLLVVANIGAGADYLDVEDSQFSDLSVDKEGRKHLRIEMNTGAVYYREIETVERLDADTERVFLVEPIPLAFTTGQVLLVSFMMSARLQGDAVELGWHHDDLMEAEVNFKSIVPYVVDPSEIG